MWSRFGRLIIAAPAPDSTGDRSSAQSDYARLLGIEPSVGSGPLAARTAVYALGNGLVELRELDVRVGLFGFSLASDDFEATAVELERAGLAVADSVSDSGGGCWPADADERRVAWLDSGHTYGVRVACEDWSKAAAPAPTSLVQNPASVRGIDHIVIRTRAPQRAIELYRDRLRIRLALDRSFPERGVRLLFFRIGGVTLELAAPLAQSANVASSSDPESDSLWGVAYQVADPSAAHARLEAEGFDLSPVRSGNKPGTRVFTVRGEPAGVPTLMIGPEDAA